MLLPVGLLALGSVQLYRGQRKLQEAAAVGQDAVREALPETLKHCDQMEHWYNEALRFKPDSYDACIYMAQLFAERCKATALFAVPVIECASLPSTPCFLWQDLPWHMLKLFLHARRRSQGCPCFSAHHCFLNFFTSCWCALP